MGFGKPRGDDQAVALRHAKKLTSARLALCVVTGLLAVLVVGLIINLGGLVGVPTKWILLLCLAVAAAAGGWLWWAVFPRHREATPIGMGVNLIDEPGLIAWVADLAREIGVDPPDGVRIAPSPGTWISDLEGTPSLVIGLGTLAWLKEEEFERLAAIELSMLRVRDHDSLVKALRFGRDLEVERLTTNSFPLVGGLVRRAGELIDRRRDALFAACAAWAVSSLPGDLRVHSGDAAEAKIVDEAWDVLVDRWVRPAADAGVAINCLAQAHTTLLEAFEAGRLIDRAWERPAGPAASALLKDAVGTDRAVSGWFARLTPELSADLVPWDEYLERVTMATWRVTVAEAVAAAGQAMGIDAPVTLETMLRAVESGWSEVIGLILVEDAVADANEARDPAAGDASLRPPIHSSRSEDAIVRALAHTVSLALVEQVVGSAELDLLWGVRIETFDGKPMEIEGHMRSFCRAQDWEGLRDWVDDTGVDASAMLRLGGAVQGRAMAVPARAIL